MRLLCCAVVALAAHRPRACAIARACTRKVRQPCATGSPALEAPPTAGAQVLLLSLEQFSAGGSVRDAGLNNAVTFAACLEIVPVKLYCSELSLLGAGAVAQQQLQRGRRQQHQLCSL